MCAIAGQYQFNGGGASLAELEKINLRQIPRGPDGAGAYSADGVALAHRRLKILDLNARAGQPMVDHTLGLALTFNGEIYNYRSVRRDLEGRGYRFVSGSDTEVLLKAFHCWSEDCLERLQGMFAFAIWERDSGRLRLARDRLGIKPLYYARNDEGLAFASTLPALLDLDGLDISIDREALQHYLIFHSVPEPLTILSGVRKAPAGAMLTFEPNGASRIKRYWSLRVREDEADQARSEAEWVEATEQALKLATTRQLAADVPVGVLLSGGLDSSLLVALAAQQLNAPIKTFSIGFESALGESGDEFVHSDQVAKRFGTDHTRLFCSNRNVARTLQACVSAMSEPMVSHDNIGFFLLSQEVAKSVKVALSGQGADEIFAGYGWFQDIESAPYAQGSNAQRILRRLADRSDGEYRRLVRPGWRAFDRSLAFVEGICRANGSDDVIDNLLAYESGSALANGPLGRVDNMTMAASLEARVPFLDETVVRLAATMPKRFKLASGGKHVLKKIARKWLPAEIVDRPKGYFPVPALKCLDGETLALMRDVLSPEAVRRRGIFEPAAIEAMLARPGDFVTPTGASKLWQVGLLELWLQRHGL